MKDENSVPTAQKMTDVSLSIFRSKFKKTRIQMIDYTCIKCHLGKWCLANCSLLRSRLFESQLDTWSSLVSQVSSGHCSTWARTTPNFERRTWQPGSARKPVN